MRSILKIIIISLIPTVCFTAMDKWGGDDRLKNPTTKYQVSNATSVGEYTLTDSTKSWTTNELANTILQPDTAVEFYMLIKSNTATQITVYGNNDCSTPHAECAWHQIDDENSGTEEYAVLDRFNLQKISNRWWLFDPYGNSFWIKSVNNFSPTETRRGYTSDGTFWDAALDANATYGGNGSGNATNNAKNMMLVHNAVKEAGFNTLGEIIDN